MRFALLFIVQTTSSRACRARQSRKRNNKSSFVAALAYSRLRERNNNFFFVALIYSCRAFVRQEYEGISGFVRRGGAALVLALLLWGWLSVKASRGRILARSHTATASPDLVCAVGACVRCGLAFDGRGRLCRPRRGWRFAQKKYYRSVKSVVFLQPMESAGRYASRCSPTGGQAPYEYITIGCRGCQGLFA